MDLLPTLTQLYGLVSEAQPVEHYRAIRSDPALREHLEVPIEVTRLYRGFWGDLRTLGSMLHPYLGEKRNVIVGLQSLPTEMLGRYETTYTPFRFRRDIAPKWRKAYKVDSWNIHAERAALYSTPPLKGRRPNKPIWCVLLMHKVTSEARENFWVNPTDPAWDLPGRSEEECGHTYYQGHQPLDVTLAYARLDLMSGPMKRRAVEGRKTVASLLNDLRPQEEWVPEMREPQVTAPGKKRKLPARLFR